MITEAKKPRVQNNDYGLADMQENLLLALDKIDQICRNNQINYSLHGGTLLGAVRNHHFIPWDDDIDVSMRREDFSRFKKLIKGDTSRQYYLDEKTIWTSRFILATDNEPVCIDIFIWDYISEYKISQFMKINLLRFLQGMMKEDINYSYYNLKGKLLVLITNFFGKLFSLKAKRRMYSFVEQKMFLGHRKYIHRSNDSYKGITYIHDKNYMGDYHDIELEGDMYLVNNRFKEFLVAEYGANYLIPPEDKDRRPKHEKILAKIKDNING